jgi:uncharacterized iron-regulated protein
VRKSQNLFGIFFIFLSISNLISQTPVRPPEKFWLSEPEIIIPAILGELESTDVLIFGEEHENQSIHAFQMKLFQALAKERSLILSLEMLEWDQQVILDEYLAGMISKRSFLSSIAHWKNFERDYLPLVEFAKTAKIPVIAANPPRRYVSKIGAEGLPAFSGFSREARTFLPSPQSILRDRSPNYESRLKSFFGSGHMGTKHSETEDLQTSGHQEILAPPSPLLLAQHTWDAGMAERIGSAALESGKLIFHINGRFHSDYGLGVTYRLRKYGFRVKTISALDPAHHSESDEFLEGKTKKFPISDFLIFANRPIQGKGDSGFSNPDNR